MPKQPLRNFFLTHATSSSIFISIGNRMKIFNQYMFFRSVCLLPSNEMANLDEVVELFLTWIPTLTSLIHINISTSNAGTYSIRSIDCRHLNTKQKLLIRRRAACFHFANRHLFNLMFIDDEINFGPKLPPMQVHPEALNRGQRGRPLARGAGSRLPLLTPIHIALPRAADGSNVQEAESNQAL